MALTQQASLRLAVSSKLLRFNPQDLSMTVYAYAKLVQSGATPPPPPTLINALAVEAADKARDESLSPQQLSNVLWALATLKHKPPAMQMPAFAMAAVRCLPASNDQVRQREREGARERERERERERDRMNRWPAALLAERRSRVEVTPVEIV